MKIDFSERLVTQECVACSITFAITETVEKQLRESQRTFNCPNGHAQSYKGKTELEKLQAQLDTSKKNAEWWEQRANERFEETQRLTRRITSLRGVIARMKKARTTRG